MGKIFKAKGTVFLLLILIVAAFLRLYKIADYMTFLGDEGRDVLMVKHLLEGDLVGIGPTASVGGFFTGPIYYYFMAPFLWLFHLDPVGPAVMVALFGIATVFLVYWVGREFFGSKAGLIAASLYAVSPLIIAYSRSSWNPNPLPFFSLLAIFTIYKGIQRKSFGYFLATGIFFGIALQLHYIASFLIVAIAIYVLFMEYTNIKGLIKKYLTIFLGFIVGYSPFLAFEAKHGFPNTKTVLTFSFGGTNETGFTGGKFIAIIGDVSFRLFGRLITRFSPIEQITLGIDSLKIDSFGISFKLPFTFLYYATLVLAMSSVFLIIYQSIKAWKDKNGQLAKFALLFFWLVIGIGLFGFYKKPIYDYYFGFMFPLPFLLVGMTLSSLYNINRIRLFGKIASIVIFFSLFLLNLDGMPFKYPPNRQLAQVREISNFILDKAQDRPFNFALITIGNSDHAYRYFFDVKGNPPKTVENTEVDPNRKTVTDQLLIVCEDTSCKPLGHPLWEVAGFGRAEIAGQWNVSVVKVFELVHYKGE